MAKTWTIGKKLYSAFGVLLVVAGIMGAAGIQGVSSMKDAVDGIAGRTAVALKHAGRIQYLIADLRAATRLMIISAARRDGKTIETKARENDEEFKELIAAADDLEKMTSIDRIKALAREIRTQMQEWNSRAAKVQELSARFEAEAAAAANDEARVFSTKAEEAAAEIFELETEKLAADREGANDTFTSVRSVMFGMVALALLFGAVGVYVVRSIAKVLRETATELGEGTQQVTVAATQVSSSAQALSQGATEQAASLEETSASMEEMASMTRKNAENTQQAAHLMTQVDSRVTESNQSLGDMVTSMAAIKESSDKVGKIIKTIDEIAFQTNILALNAAVEAARAGEAGMGFAVVADEVRNLAQRSAQAAKDTAVLIEESIAKSAEGAIKVQQVAGSIQGITEAVGQVKGLVEEVSVASRQQAQGIDQVSQAVSQMEKVTQTTAATAEESAAASEELNAQAEQSMGLVNVLQAMVGGSASGTAPATHRTPARKPAGGNVVAMPSAHKSAHGAATHHVSNAEEQIPLEHTGTFGKF